MIKMENKQKKESLDSDKRESPGVSVLSYHSSDEDDYGLELGLNGSQTEEEEEE